MRENNSYSNSSGQEANIIFQDDSMIRRLQEDLINMGFDIIMVNKVISKFNVKNVDEAIDYLLKNEDGTWSHPFIPKENENEVNMSSSGIFAKRKKLMSSIMNAIRTVDITDNKKRISKSVNVQIESPKQNELKIEICDICGELKEFHNIKNYEKDNNKISFNNNIFIDDDILNNNNKDNQNINLNLEEEINQNECPICMGNIDDPMEVENCKHKFCFECFHSYLVNLININNIDQIPCPKKNCTNKKISEDFFNQYLSNIEYFKYRQLKSQNEIARDPKKAFCPFCESYAQIGDEFNKNIPQDQKTTLKCLNGHEFCSCGRPLHENECYKEGKDFQKLLKEEKIKRCPKCGFLIKKTEGCNHMTCGNPLCKYEFCWICMQEAIPDHYSIGPCAGKQFIDPDSFLYWFRENFQWLFIVLRFIGGVLLIIGLVIAFFIIPGFGLILFAYGFVIEEFRDYFEDKFIQYVDFLICVCLAFPCQSIVYNIFILIYLMIIYIKYVLPILVILSVIIVLIIYCGCIKNRPREINHDFIDLIEENEIEMANRMNDNNNNNNNIEEDGI